MRIQSVFENLLHQGKKALIPYITAGDPSIAATEELVIAMDQAGEYYRAWGTVLRSIS